MDEDIESSVFSKFSFGSNSIDNNIWEIEDTCLNNDNIESCSKLLRRPTSLSISWNTESFSNKYSPALNRWFKAVDKICRKDYSYEELYPWQNFPIESIKSERAIRFRYSAIKKKWVKDKIIVKLENLPFDHGAMRECFRLKKLSHGVKNNDWNYCSNYVAKRYIKDCKRDVYFEDVKLQMEAKLWAEEYNRQNPPKKVDIFQLAVIEFEEKENRPLYHIEHYMEGNYRKYNSNSGFVDDSCIRNTPHAFSHFTFERSGHRMMVVDIQGVGDLYTDPQIHTTDGLNYGDGNLGLRGMSLFFSSHRCNPICQYLGLSKFDMHNTELRVVGTCVECAAKLNVDESGKVSENISEEYLINNDSRKDNSNQIIVQLHDFVAQKEMSTRSVNSAGDVYKPRQRSISFKMPGTIVRDDRHANNVSESPPSFLDDLFPPPVDLMRALSVDSGVLSASIPAFVSSQGNLDTAGALNDSEIEESESVDCCSSVTSNHNCTKIPPSSAEMVTSTNQLASSSSSGAGYWTGAVASMLPSSSNNPILRRGKRRQRNYSEGSDIDAVIMQHNDEHLSLYHFMRENHKPSCADHPTNLDQEIGHSILAQVHHEMARLHECGRIAKLNLHNPGKFLHQHFWSNLVDVNGDDDHSNNHSLVDPRMVSNNNIVETGSEINNLAGEKPNKSANNSTDSDNSIFYMNNDRDNLAINWSACLFHERHAAQLGCLEAVIVMARYSLNMSGHMLQDCPLEPTQLDRDCGLDYLWRAADSGDRRSMIELANKYRSVASTSSTNEVVNNRSNETSKALTDQSYKLTDESKEEISNTNLNSGKSMCTDWSEAVRWYRRAFDAISKSEGQIDARDAEGKYDSADDLLPPQEILASMASLYLTGGYNLEKDCSIAGELYSQAAEIATNAMQGRQAAKYYELADEAYSQLEE